MAFNMNFNTPLKLAGDGTVVVTGTSEPVEGATLVSRGIVLRQGIAVAEAAAPGDPDWTTEPLSGLAEGDALALGTEVHAVDTSQTQGIVATLVTVTWSQTIRIDP